MDFRPTTREIFQQLGLIIQQKRGNDVDFACIYRFNIKPNLSWVLEVFPVNSAECTVGGKVYEMNMDDNLEAPKVPDCILTYDSEDVFIDISLKKLSPQKAFVKRKLSIKGNMAKMRFLQNIMEEGHKQKFMGIANTAKNGAASVLSIRPRFQWEPDAAREGCGVCSAKFKVTLRKHHCRFCGMVVCSACSIFRINDHRACGLCASGTYRNAPLDRETAEQMSVVRQRLFSTSTESGDVEILKQQVVDLQEKVATLTKDSEYFYARVLLFLVHVWSRLLVLFLLALSLGISHLTAQRISPFLTSKVVILLNYKGAGIFSKLACQGAEKTVSLKFLEMLSRQSLSCQEGWSPFLYLLTFIETSSIVYWLVMFHAVIGIVLYYSVIAKGLLPRRIKTLSFAALAIIWLRETKRRCKTLSKADADAAWDKVHRILSPYMYLGILEQKGLLVKMGQYLSSRADVIPVAFLEELCKLQDCVPPSPFEQIKHTIEEGLGNKIDNLFTEFSEDVLAAASIAQVHRAKLKDGTDVVVKVQHPEVRHLMTEDIHNIQLTVRVVAFFEPEFDFRVIMEEWSKGVNRELDFCNEAENLDRVYKAMLKSAQNVEIPKLIPHLVSEKVVVMTFCQGWKVTEWEQLSKLPPEEREKLMESICKAFAYQMHVDGLFNGDPHPGNILVQAEESHGGKALKNCRPVLLDWGLAKAFDEDKRLAFAKFVYSTSEMDLVSMLQSFTEMGLKLNRFDPGEDMNNLRHMFRDTAPPEEARAKHKKWERKWIKKRKKVAKTTGRKNPVDAYPGDLLFFIRATELLHGLGARLRVRTPYLKIIAPFAKQALIDSVPPSLQAKGPIFPSPCLTPLEAKVRNLITELINNNLITGCQVCVYKNGDRVVDTCAGVQGAVDPRPVTPKTVFCALSVSKAVLATIVHSLVDRKLLSYDTPLASIWEGFGKNGKEGVTVHHVLTHSTGLQHALPSQPTFDDLCDWSKVQKALEDATPIWEPGSRCSYHYFSFGWLLAAVIERVTKKPLDEVMQETIAHVLGMQDEMFLGDITKSGIGTDRIATLESDLAKKMHEMAPPEEQQEEESDDEDGEVSIAGLAFLATGIKEEDESEGKALEELARKLKGREYLLDPRMFNYPPLRDAVFPAANGHFTARALAALFNHLLFDMAKSDNRPGMVRVLSRDIALGMRKFQTSDRASYLKLFGQAEGVRYGLGYQLFGFQDQSNGGFVRHTAFGHVGMGGSIALCDPVTGFAFAMTVNKIVEGRKSSNNVLELVCKELGVGLPVHVFSSSG